MVLRDLNELLEEKNTLIIKRMQMDKFFSRYLEKFERKMDPEKPNTNIWKLYRAKMAEYGKISQEIKNLDYWISKAH